jgi:putative membrane protein
MAEDPALAELTTEMFIQKAAASGMKEVRAAEIALRQAGAEQVKEFARAMIAAHSRQNSRLSTLAVQDNIQLPKELPAEQREEMERLSGRTGAAFDEAYAQQMRSDRQQAVVLFRSCARSMRVRDEVRNFCTTQLPALQEHQQQARMLDQQSNATRSAASEEE